MSSGPPRPAKTKKKNMSVDYLILDFGKLSAKNGIDNVIHFRVASVVRSCADTLGRVGRDGGCSGLHVIALGRPWSTFFRLIHA